MILMNETIGVKGGKNDRRRSLLITKKAKEKLQAYQEEKELKKLEEKDGSDWIGYQKLFESNMRKSSL